MYNVFLKIIFVCWEWFFGSDVIEVYLFFLGWKYLYGEDLREIFMFVEGFLLIVYNFCFIVFK